MIWCMDDQIGRVVAELEKKGMRDKTLIVFMSDNGGNLSSLFAGELDVSKLKLPSDFAGVIASLVVKGFLT